MRIHLFTARVIYLTVWLLVAVFAALSETGIIATGYLVGDAETSYALHMLCVVLTLGGTWVGLRVFALKSVRRCLSQKPQSIPYLNLLRIAILALPIFTNLIVYYALLSGTTPLFCLLIALTGFVFCWPKKDE